MDNQDSQNKITLVEKRLQTDEDFLNKLWAERKTISDRFETIEADIVRIDGLIDEIHSWMIAHG